MTHSIPTVADSPRAPLRWVEGRAALSAAQQGTVRLRFALCGRAKLFSFTAWPGAPVRAAAGAARGRGGDRSPQPPPPPPPSGHQPQGEPISSSDPAAGLRRTGDNGLTDEERRAALWRGRLADLQAHAVAFGRCSLLPCDNSVPMVPRAHDTSANARFNLTYGPCPSYNLTLATTPQPHNPNNPDPSPSPSPTPNPIQARA